ncbi:MAG: radical SAM protein [Bacteroidales bacterium]|nr:radical SAM protein [Bacteroidales bacterium]
MTVKEFRNWANIIIFRKLKTPPVTHIEIETSTKCNLNCIMCKMSERTKINKNKLLSFDDACYFFNEIKAPRVTLSHNGEPFLNPEIFRIINYIYKKGSWTSVTTNFSFLPGSPKDLVKSGLNILKISLDAATPETYNKIRKNSDFDSIIKTIKNLLLEKEKLSSKNPLIRLGFVIQEQNYKEIDLFVRLAANLGIKFVRFYMLHPMTDSILPITFRLPLLQEKIHNAKRISLQEGIQTNLKSLSINNFSIYAKLNENNYKSSPILFKEEMINRKTETQCLQPWLSCNILIDGTVSPCCTLAPPDESRVQMGNIFSLSWEKIWNGESYKLFREMVKSGKSLRCINECYDPRSFWNLFSFLRNVLPTIK